jgi:hypothetical protein
MLSIDEMLRRRHLAQGIRQVSDQLVGILESDVEGHSPGARTARALLRIAWINSGRDDAYADFAGARNKSGTSPTTSTPEVAPSNTPTPILGEPIADQERRQGS